MDTLGNRELLMAANFAADKHVSQCRKGDAQEPYVNHLIEVAGILADSPAGGDVALLMAALLHDTVEDTNTTFEEIQVAFGADVTALVRAATDDKTLKKVDRKRLQVETASHKPARARMLKIADKISNLRSMAHSPPAGWDAARILEYVDWATAVVEGCCAPETPDTDDQVVGAIAALRGAFDAAVVVAQASVAVK